MPQVTQRIYGDLGPRGIPLSAYYRPLQGVTSLITSELANELVGSDTPIYWNANAGKYRYVGLTPENQGVDTASCINNNSGLGQAPTYHQQPIVVEFWSDATSIKVWAGVGGNQDIWALVDDQRISPTWLHTGFDGLLTWTLTQDDAVWHKWRISFGPVFFSLQVNAGASIVESLPGFQLAVVGDSFVEGSFSSLDGTIASGAPFGEFEQFTGLDVWRFGVGGTGYVNQGGLGTAGPYAAEGRIARLASAPTMDAVIVFGGGNDVGTDVPTVVEAAVATWSAVSDAQPDAPLIVVGLEAGSPQTATDALNDALAEAAADHEDVLSFVDIRNPSFITGTGHVGAVTGNGNSDAFIGPDNTHPSHAGSRWYGESLARILGSVLLPSRI